jgi:uncharacterized protein YbjT (DUF2867 family)
LEALGVRVRQGDFDEPATLAAAFEGATQVLVVSSNARAYGGDPLAQHRAAIDAARAVGARRVVYTSHMGASAGSKFPPMRDHVATEEMLALSGLKWTSLRNGFYAASAMHLLGDVWKTGLVEAPADGKVSWTAHADLAEGAAAVLAEEGCFEGPTPPLTGGEALDLADMVAIVAKLADKPMRREVIADEELERRMAARGLPPHVGAIALGLYRASRGGEFQVVDPTLARLIGHAPTAVRDLLAGRVER